MEIIPIGDRTPEDYGWTVEKSYSPSACLAYARDESGTARPIIYSFAREAWLTAERNSVATELPMADQMQLARLLAKNVKVVVDAIAGVRAGTIPVIGTTDDDDGQD